MPQLAATPDLNLLSEARDRTRILMDIASETLREVLSSFPPPSLPCLPLFSVFLLFFHTKLPSIKSWGQASRLNSRATQRLAVLKGVLAE